MVWRHTGQTAREPVRPGMDRAGQRIKGGKPELADRESEKRLKRGWGIRASSHGRPKQLASCPIQLPTVRGILIMGIT